MSSDQNSTPTFAGEFSHGVDLKGRVTVPFEWRVKVEGEPYFLVADRSRTFLHAMPPEHFRAIAEKVEKDDRIPAAEKSLFLAQFYSRATQVATDKQGRLLLPEKARQELGLKDNIVLVGAFHTFQLFNKEKWEQRQREAESVFARVAEQLGV